MRRFDNGIWVLGLVVVFFPLKHLSRFYGLIPSYLGNFTPFMLIVLAAALIIFTRRRSRRLPTETLVVLGLLIVLSLIGMSANQTSPFSVVYYLRWILFIVLFYKLTYQRLLEKGSDELLRLLVMFSYGMAYLVFIQRLILVEILSYWNGDIVTGVFGVDYFLTFFQLFTVVIIVTYWIHGRTLSPRFSNTHLLAVISLSIAASNNKASFGFFALIIGYMMFASRRYFSREMVRRWSLVMVMGAIGILVFNFIWTYNHSSKLSLAYLMDPRYIAWYYFGDGDEGSELSKDGVLRRGASMVFSARLITSDTERFLIGYGPGTTNQSENRLLRGSLHDQYPDYNIDKVGISALLLNMGIIGTSLFFYFHWQVFRRSRRSHQPRHIILIERTTIVLMVLFLFYQNLPPSPLSGLVFGLMMAMQEFYNTEFKRQQLIQQSKAQADKLMSGVDIAD